MAKKAYIVDYSIKNDHRIDCDTAIVFAESESEVKSVMENYVHLLNENYGIWISNTDFIRLNNNHELDAIYSVKEFTGSVFTRLFTDDDEVRNNN
jgi:hypothetical protein